MAHNDVEVSVLCIAYNHEKYIRKALDAFVAQKTNFKYEVLINDDASTDNTAEIIREYAEEYPDIIKPYFQTENQYSQNKSNLQFLGERAKGKYFAFCEGDDYWIDNDKLQKQYDVMASNPNVSLCVHKVQCVNEDMSANMGIIPEERLNINQDRVITQDEFSDILFVRGSYAFHTSSYFVTRELFFSEERKKMIGKMNGDQIIMSCSLLYGDVYYINEIMSHRRMMTIGNSHQRFAESSVEKKVTHLLKYYKGCSFFVHFYIFSNQFIEFIWDLYVYRCNIIIKLLMIILKKSGKK